MLHSDCFGVMFDPPFSCKVPEDRKDARTEGRQRFILSRGESEVLFGLFLKDTAISASTNRKVFAGCIAGGLRVCFILKFSLHIKLTMRCFCSYFVACCGLDVFSESIISILLRLRDLN